MKELYVNGASISEIARQTGHDRKTVRKYVLGNNPPTNHKKRKSQPSILDPYKDYIKEKVRLYDISGVRAFEDIQKMGYPGRITIVRDFIQTIRDRNRIKAEYRYETKSGVQAQVDWGTYGRIEQDNKLRILHGFNLVLGYSRMRYLEFTTDEKTETFLQCHLNAFSHFGGYPNEFLYDNIKSVVLKRAIISSESKWNPMFEDFFTHFGFQPRLCRPYRAKSKGKVERSVRYTKDNFFKGRTYTSIQDLNAQALEWCNHVNSKPHGTTGIPPIVRLQEELKDLHSFNAKPQYQIVIKADRLISNDCYVSYRGNKYSVPWKYAGREAQLQIKDGKLEVRVSGETICIHECRVGSGARVRVKEHFEGLYAAIRSKNLQEHLQREPLQVALLPKIEVEKRPLEVYDEFCNQEGSK